VLCLALLTPVEGCWQQISFRNWGQISALILLLLSGPLLFPFIPEMQDKDLILLLIQNLGLIVMYLSALLGAAEVNGGRDGS
jgi:hypothetical protein